MALALATHHFQQAYSPQFLLHSSSFSSRTTLTKFTLASSPLARLRSLLLDHRTISCSESWPAVDLPCWRGPAHAATRFRDQPCSVPQQTRDSPTGLPIAAQSHSPDSRGRSLPHPAACPLLPTPL